MGNNNIKEEHEYRVMVIDIKCVDYKISKYMACNCLSLGSDYNSIDQLWRLFLEEVPLGVNYEIYKEEDVINEEKVFCLKMKDARDLVCNIKYKYDISDHMYIKNVTNDCHMCLSKTQCAMYYNILEKMPKKTKEIIVDKSKFKSRYYAYLSYN